MKWLGCFILFYCCAALAYGDDIRFRPGDTIEVNVFNSPELSGIFRIHTDGCIRMPLAGRIEASGKTEEELNETIHASVDTFIKNPYITIIPKYSVSMIGYVNKPGTFTVSGSEKLIELVAMAGGFSPEASGDLSLYRSGKRVSIARNSILYNDSSLGYLQPGDVLSANKKRLTRADYSIIISTLSAISLSVFYLSRDH